LEDNSCILEAYSSINCHCLLYVAGMLAVMLLFIGISFIVPVICVVAIQV